jgi:transcription elongation GreA/GreB family factor
MIANDLALKLSIHQHCINLIEEKINTIQKEYRLYQDSAANETKSSAGDKHDTGKAMMQMEQEKLGIQFKELVNSKKILGSINPSTRYNKIQFGSFIKTETSWFYISISLGKISIDSHEIFILSSQTPLSKLMLNKSVGDAFSFNGKHYKVTEVC